MLRPPRLVVLVSGSGTTLQAILDAADLCGSVVAVGTDRPACVGLQRAAVAGIPTFAVVLADHPDRASWNRAIENAIAAHDPDLVVLAGFMRLLDGGVVSRFRIVNTHPALLPAFPGAHALRDALIAGATDTGVTVHWVDEGIDTGPIIAQVAVPIEANDDENTLRVRIQAAERPLYVATITELCQELSRENAP